MSNIGFKLLADRVLIDPIPVEEQTKGGIILAHTQVNATPTTGTVVAVGPGRYDAMGNLLAVDVKEGDRVTWHKFAGTQMKIGEKTYLLMREGDLAGVFSDEC